MGLLHHDRNGHQSLVSEEFTENCVSMGVEARVQAFPHPGDPMHANRLITFKNFNECNLKITQFNKKNQVHIVPARGECQIMLTFDEELPKIEKEPT